ncbi:Stomatin [Candidatus Tiddalikarchaeum anstoanum]|nr:Stomatin [Candidatus Tiddalikarchaeum anstoanum]
MKGEILIVILLLAGVVWVFYNYSWTFYLFITLLIITVFYLFFVKKYDEFERGIIFRMGKFNRVVGPGWSVVMPFFEKEFSRIDARTHMIDIQIDEAYTSDDLKLELDGLFYYTVIDPEKAVLKIDDYTKGLKNIIVGETRNILGSMNMREVFANIDKLNDILLDKIRHTSWKWGIDVPMLQLKSVTPPIEIAEAMQSKEIASQQLQAKRFKAEAEKVVISAIGSAAKNLNDKAVMYLYIQALKDMGSGQGAKIIFPAEFMKIVDTVGSTNAALKGLDVTSLISQIKDKIVEEKK